MSNIKTEFSHKVEYDVFKYTTTDGQEFTDQFKAQDHQLYLDGKKKVCDKCKGAKGETINCDDWNSSWTTRWVECKKCSGKGYLELKFA